MHAIQINPVMLARGRANRNGQEQAYHTLDARRTALIVVDMQVAYLSETSPVGVPMAREIIGNINSLSTALRNAGGLNVFIRKTYDPNEPNSWSNWYNGLLGQPFSEGLMSVLTPGTATHEIDPRLTREPSDLVIDKTRFSAFTHGTSALHDELRARDIDTVIVTGTLTNFCSESTARDACQLNYNVIFVSDGNAALTDEEHNTTLGTLYTCYADVLPTDRIVEMIAAAGEKGAA